MSIAEDVETLGRATPGVHWGADEDGDPEPYLDGTVGDVLVWPEADGRYSVQVWGPPPMLERRVTAPELGLLLRCVASGLEVDLGPCPDCEGAKVQKCWTTPESHTFTGQAEGGWAEVGTSSGTGNRRWERPCPTCSEPGPEVECGACDGGHGLVWVDGYWVDCDACKGTGKRPGPGVPTGRETVGLTAAWMRGRPEPWLTPLDLSDGETDAWMLLSRVSSGPDGAWVSDGWAHVGTRQRGHIARIMKRHPECIERRRLGRDPYEYRMTLAPADPSTRKALAVIADKRQSEGDPLGELLALDLAGAECPGGCDHQGYVYPSAATYCPCPTCEGHGTALAQRLRQLGTAAHPAASLTAAVGA